MKGSESYHAYRVLHNRVAVLIRGAGVNGFDAELVAADLLAHRWVRGESSVPSRLVVEHAVVDFKRALSRRARGLRRIQETSEVRPTDPDPDHRAEGRLVRAAVKDGLRSVRARIGGEALDIIALRCGYGLSQTEVARRVGLSQATVSRRLDHGLYAMRSELTRRGITARQLASTPRALLLVHRVLERRAKRLLPATMRPFSS